MKAYITCSNRCALKSCVILFAIATTTAVRISLSFCLNGWSTDETKYQEPQYVGGMDVCLLRLLCVLSGRGLCDEMITRSEESN